MFIYSMYCMHHIFIYVKQIVICGNLSKAFKTKNYFFLKQTTYNQKHPFRMNQQLLLL